jgi:hypothetical protein
MKIKPGFMLREIAGQWVVVPIGGTVVDFNNIITLSESGAFLWRMLEKGANEEELVNAILTEYEVDDSTARRDVKTFVDCIVDKALCI